VGNEVREVGGENFGTEKGAEKSLGRGRGCVSGSSPKQLNDLILNWCTGGCWFTPAAPHPLPCIKYLKI